MQTKKNPKYDLDRLRVIIFNIALLISLTIITAAFGWGGNQEEGIDILPEINALENQKATQTTLLNDSVSIAIEEEAIEIIVEMDFEEDEYLNQNDVWMRK